MHYGGGTRIREYSTCAQPLPWGCVQLVNDGCVVVVVIIFRTLCQLRAVNRRIAYAGQLPVVVVALYQSVYAQLMEQTQRTDMALDQEPLWPGMPPRTPTIERYRAYPPITSTGSEATLQWYATVPVAMLIHRVPA